jgi:release factor glutamine methyltransferase
MTIEDWLHKATGLLEAENIATARLDALVLLGDALLKDKAWLLAHPETLLQGKTLQTLNAQIERRTHHEPLAYIRGKSEFYGREFLVTPDTLQPRPETETMIDLLKKHIIQHCKARPCNVVDVGTGSGCIAITAKLEFPDVRVYATEINKDALKVAQRNAERLSADVKFFEGNLLKPIPHTIYQLPTTIVANLPYVPNSHTINQAAMQEPEIAIFGGEDGLDLYRQLFTQIMGLDQKPATVLCESLPFQHAKLNVIAQRAGYELQEIEDFIQVFAF